MAVVNSNGRARVLLNRHTSALIGGPSQYAIDTVRYADGNLFSVVLSKCGYTIGLAKSLFRKSFFPIGSRQMVPDEVPMIKAEVVSVQKFLMTQDCYATYKAEIDGLVNAFDKR